MNETRQRGTILVLEDDPGIGRLQRLQLERAGYRVELTTNTTDARARLSAHRIDLLLLDYQLSEPTNGLEFYRSLQQESREIAAILVTGYGDETRVIEAMRAGVRDFIPKTPNFIELVEPTVERVMKQVQSERQLLEAEAASRAKDHFIATLSHELRTPLTPVLALVSALQRDERLPQDVQEDMGTIFRNIELEARLIDDMLDITRIAKGKLELQFETMDIRPIIEHAVKTCCAHEAAEKMITCHETLVAGEHLARVDAARLTQVLWNVLKNAIKFTPVGGQIFLSTRHEEADGGRWLVVEVEDTGIGIAPHILPRVFGAFQQGDRSITQQFGGLGLGLAISKAIMEAHGGTITAASPGTNLGSTFTVRLPLSQMATAAVEIEPKNRSRQESVHAPETGHTHLLLVEDHPDTAHVMARMLRRAGFQVTVASNIAQAIAETEVARKAVNDSGRARPVRLVISDLGLPDGSGCDLMRRLRAEHRLRGIALSGFGMEDDVKQAEEAGFSRHLTKPVDFELLLSAIRELLTTEQG
ncbi:MAG TPA: response regulator [Chthoniobacter sp.]|nr:response regulator [Chthoniobacter sp.]